MRILVYSVSIKLILQVQRLPTPKQAAQFKATIESPVTDFVGVDLGVQTLATTTTTTTTTDDGERFSGQVMEACGERYHGRRKAL
jgi:hypothetical protein